MNHLNKIGTSFFSGLKIIRASSFVFIAAAFIVGGFFAPSPALAVISEIEVTGPVGGAHLNDGVNITWTAIGEPDDLVDIYYSTNNFTNSTKLTTSGVAYDAGSYNWDTVAAGVPDNTNYKVKVKSIANDVNGISLAAFTIDNTPPTITSRVTLDTNGDGNVDKLDITFSEPVRDSSFSAASFTIDGQPGTSVTGTPNDNTLSVLFSAVTGTNQKSVTYTAGTGTDMATPGNLLATNTASATDSAAPVFLSAKTKTTTTIDLTFSEDLNGVTVTNSDFAVSGNTLTTPDALEVTPGVVRITLTTPIGTGDTPNVTVSGPIIQDLAGNPMVVPVTKTPTDGVAPVLAEVTPVTTPTLDDTPDYTFSSSEAGAISYGGLCASVTPNAVFGNNPITFNILVDGIYNTCTIQVTDSSGNISTFLAVSSFQIDTTPVEVTNITSESGALTIGSTEFSPALSSPLLRMQNVHYAVRAISIVAQIIPNVQWKITVEGPAGFIPDMVDLDEVGWSDIGSNPDSTTIFHYPFAGSGTLVATGSCTNPDPVHDNSCATDSFDVDSTDNFKNVDRVNFLATAPLGTYTIKRQLIENSTTPRSNELIVATFTVTNNPPVLDEIGNETINEESEFSFTATATDPEESDLTFTLIGAPAGAEITEEDLFTWTPTEAQGPNTYSFTVQVTDADNGIDTELIQVTVNEVNVAPVATGASVTTNEDTGVLITLPATDADILANTLTYSIVVGPTKGTLGLVTGNQVTYTPNQNYNGADSFTFQVTDNGVPALSSTVETIAITVTPVNDAPVLTAISNQAVVAGNLLTFTAVSTDVDGGTPAYSLTGAPTGAIINSLTGLFSWTPTISGVYSFSVVVSDGNEGTDSQTVQVTVNHATIAKVVISAAPINLSVANQSTITVTGKDQFNNITTSDNSTVVVLSADNGGSLGTTLLTLISGLAETTLSKSSAGNVHVNALSGVLTPSQVTVTFNALPGDILAPSLVSHNPANDSINVSVGVTPFLVFSEPLKSSTVNSTNIQLKKYSDDSVVPATVSLVEGGTQVNIDPTSPLENNTQYYFAVSTGVQDEVGNALTVALDTSTKSSHEFTTVAIQPIVVDEIIAQNSTAVATDSYLDGWHYTFRITVNTDETDLSVKFDDWENSANSALTVPANDNMRLLFNTATGNGLGSVVGLTDADIVSGVGPISSFALGNAYTDQTPGAINISALDTSTDPGRQIKFDVYTKLPVSTAPGFYETVFGIKTQ